MERVEEKHFRQRQRCVKALRRRKEEIEVFSCIKAGGETCAELYGPTQEVFILFEVKLKVT